MSYTLTRRKYSFLRFKEISEGHYVHRILLILRNFRYRYSSEMVRTKEPQESSVLERAPNFIVVKILKFRKNRTSVVKIINNKLLWNPHYIL